MTKRCPACGGYGHHEPNCLYFARTPEGTGGGCLLLAGPYVALALLAAGLITWAGWWPDVAAWVHQLAHSIAPGLVH